MGKKPAPRLNDTRIEVTRRVFAEYARRFHIDKGTVIDGWIDSEGNFRFKEAVQNWLGPVGEETVIHTGYYKVLGKFYLRKKKS